MKPSTDKPSAPAAKEYFDTPSDLERAIDEAKMNGQPLHFEVTEKLFHYLVRGQKTGYATYKDGKIFLPGTKKELLKQDRMNAEEYGDLMNKRASEVARARMEMEDAD